MNDQQQNESLKTSIIERWRQSSPWEQRRLELLKEAVENGVEGQLYDLEEQQKYGLNKDEFLVFACRYGRARSSSWVYKNIMIPYGVIILLLTFISPYIKSVASRNFYVSWLCILSVALVIGMLTVAVMLVRGKYLLLSNYSIYFGKKIRQLNKMPLDGLLIKTNIDISDGIRNIFCIDVLIFKDCRLGTAMCIGANSFAYYIENHRTPKKIDNSYILYVFSYLSRQYHHGLYVFPLRCGFTCDREDYAYSILNIFIGTIAKILRLLQPFRRDIEHNFSDQQDIQVYLTGRKIAGCNSEAIISLLKDSVNTGNELFRLPATQKIYGKEYEIHVTGKEIWIESNGVKTTAILPLSDIEIYHSHKYFIFLFPDNGKYVPYFVWKINIFFPFLDIMEILLQEKIAYMGSGYLVWES